MEFEVVTETEENKPAAEEVVAEAHEHNEAATTAEVAVETAVDATDAAELSADAAAAAKKDHGHESFDIMAAILHHNMPYPAWDIAHKPLILFDKGVYAAINYDYLSKKEAYATAQPNESTIAWAKGVKETPDFRYDLTGVSDVQLAKAMTVAEGKTFFAFPKFLSFFSQQTFFGTIALLLLTVFLTVVAKRKASQLKPAGRLQHAFESIVVYLRDEVVKPAIPHHTNTWLPFLSAVFFMILAVNLFGLIPGTGTMSGNIGVTGAWSACILGLMLFFGMKEQGPKYWITLVPIHFSWPMSPVWVLLLIIEVMGLVIKPAALAIRLFANMFAGHTVLVVFLSLGYIAFAANPDSIGLAIGLKGFGWLLAVAFHAMEVLVAFIQAYVFTLLAAMFIGMSIHPEH